MHLDMIQSTQCHMSGMMWVEAARAKYDLKDLYFQAMHTIDGELLYSKDNYCMWLGAKYALEYFNPKSGNDIKNEDMLYWIGYVMKFWNFYKPEWTSVMIYDAVPWDTWTGVYLGFHCLSPEMAIDNLIEIYHEWISE